MRRHALVAGLVGLLAAATLLGACTDDGDGGSSAGTTLVSGDRQTVVTRLVDEVLTPLVQSAASAAATAEEVTAAYCAAPSPESQQAAVDAVDVALHAYEQLDPVDMGPIMVRRTDGHVAYPVDVERVEEVLADAPSADAEDIAERTPSSVRGLTTARYLLSTSPTPGDDPTRCAFLVAIVADARTSIDAVVLDSLVGADGESPYYGRLTGEGDGAEPPKETIDVIVNMVLTVLDTDAGLLADPGDLDPDVVRQAASAHMATVALLWGDGSGGLSVLVDGELAARTASEIATAQQALDGDDDPDVAQAAVEEVRATAGTEVVSALDVVVGFSENDGDS